MAVLVVDDSEDIRLLVSTHLKSAGYSDIMTASSAEEVFELLGLGESGGENKGQIPDLILLDIMLPDMDGIDLCKKLRQNELFEEIPIVMVTAKQESSELENAFLAGATDYIRKPIDRIELQARVRLAIKLKQRFDMCEEKKAEIAELKQELEEAHRKLGEM